MEFRVLVLRSTTQYVLAIAASIAIWLFISNVQRCKSRGKREKVFAMQHGCEFPRSRRASLPFGLDFLIKTFHHASRGRVMDFFTEDFAKCPTTHEQTLFLGSEIKTVDPENVEALLAKQFEEFNLGLRPAQFSDLMGSAIFTQDGAEWKHSRSLLRPQFTQNRQQNFNEIKVAVDKFLDQLPSDGIVDLQVAFFNLTLDTTLFLLFGNAAFAMRDAETTAKHAHFAAAFSDGLEYLTTRLRLGPLYYLVSTPRYRKTCADVHKLVDDMVQKAIDAKEEDDPPEKPYVFIDALVEQTKDKKVLRDQCLNILLAGRDTTACLLSWTMRLLLRHARCLSKVRAEIEAVVGRRPPTREDLKQMPYLSHVITEVLRLYPSVPINFRAASKMTTLPLGGGAEGKAPILVRKGQTVAWAPYIMQRRKDVFGEDAPEFRPERWEHDALKDVGYAYVPFNGGPRACLGQELALLEARYTVVRLLQSFSFELPEGEESCPVGKEPQTVTLVVSAAEGCRVRCRAVAD